MRELRKKEFDVIYSAHDRCGIPKEYLNSMIRELETEVPDTTMKVELPQIGSMYYYTKGNPYTLDYFDIAFIKEQA